MSFRGRLTLFFVLIVIVPMLSVAIVLFRLISDNETGKEDAGVGARQRAAINLYRGVREDADRAVQDVGSDRVLASALRANDRGRAARRARQLLASRELARIAIVKDGKAILDVGSHSAIASGDRRLTDGSGTSFGVLSVATDTASGYARQARRITTLELVVRSAGGRTLGTSLKRSTKLPKTLPSPGRARDVDAADKTYRAASFDAAGFRGARLRVTVLGRNADAGADLTQSRLLAGGILLGFLVLALTFALAVSRSLQAQIGSFLAAARRLAGGDFSTDVPTAGSDEFAELGVEFNSMAGQLQGRLSDLEVQRERLETALRRIGASFESTLDRDALLELVVQTAVDGLGAEAGRARASRGGEELEVIARAGEPDAVSECLLDAEAQTLENGEPGEATAAGVHALAHPLRGPDEEGQTLGVISVARLERPFTESERELFAYLASTVGVSVENVELHEAVARQAVTDELTGLFNHRRFQEAMTDEVERARRFAQPMGLVMLDIDNFKRVNDTYGHQQGDQVLMEVSRVLRESSREIDSPSRYGGEELAVVLPQTDLEGAYNLAERVREGIEALVFELGDGREPLRVTASLGVASLPQTADEPAALIAGADAALYEAKHGGKNQTVRADDDGTPR